MVTTLLVIHRIGYYCHQPFGKVFPPFLGIGYAHTVGKGGYCSLFHCWQTMKIGLYRIDLWGEVALYDAV